MTPTIDQLNDLMDKGLISDNAAFWADVADCDKARALEWLQAQMTGQQQEMGI
jgi:hypothetical protein